MIVWMILPIAVTLCSVSVAARRSDNSYLVMHSPENVTARQGGSARFNCSIDTEDDVYWQYGRHCIGPWPAVADQEVDYSYPKDALVPLHQFDIIISNVTLENHDQARFHCRTITGVKLVSSHAYLKVIVPPSVDMQPKPQNGIIKVKAPQKNVTLTCVTNFADPPFEIQWIIDGYTSPVLETEPWHTRPSKRRLLWKKESNHTIPRQKTADDKAREGTAFSPELLKSLRHTRKLIEKNYSTTYHVTCRVVRNATVLTNATQSAWVLFEYPTSVVEDNAAGTALGTVFALLALLLVTGIVVYLRCRPKWMGFVEKCLDRITKEREVDSKSVTLKSHVTCTEIPVVSNSIDVDLVSMPGTEPSKRYSLSVLPISARGSSTSLQTRNGPFQGGMQARSQSYSTIRLSRSRFVPSNAAISESLHEYPTSAV